MAHEGGSALNVCSREMRPAASGREGTDQKRPIIVRHKSRRISQSVRTRGEVTFPFKMPISDAIRSLQQVTLLGPGPQPTQQQMLTAIDKVEREYPCTDSAELAYWLGGAWRCYTAWFIRGDDRKPYLEKTAMYLERAYTLEKSSSGVKWMTYASVLGGLLVEEAMIRDLQRGIPLLESVFQSTQDYEPLLCTYAEGVYKTGDYQKAAAIATELHRRAKKSNEWKDIVPPAPMRIAAMAYRAQIKQLKKDGKTKEALAVSEKLLHTGAATDNDQRIHEKFVTLVGKTKMP